MSENSTLGQQQKVLTAGSTFGTTPTSSTKEIMNADAIREFCLKKKGKITEGFPFGEGVLVFKVEGKMFLLMSLDEHPVTMNVSVILSSLWTYGRSMKRFAPATT